MIDVELTPNADMLQMLGLSHDRINQAMANALNESAMFAHSAIVESTPTDTGRLRQSWAISHATPESLEAVVSTAVEYATAVEFGTGRYSENPLSDKEPYTITAKNAKALRFTSGGKTYIRKSATIQGTHPRSMVRSNIPSVDLRLQQALATHLRNILNEG